MSIQSLQQQMESKVRLKNLFRTRQLATIELGTVVVESFILKERLVFDDSDLKLLYQVLLYNLNHIVNRELSIILMVPPTTTKRKSKFLLTCSGSYRTVLYF